MRIYNTMSREKEELKTINEGVVTIYACGPTVYNLMHIGNARQICVFDTLRRFLKYRGYEVKYAQNFTDVDDKIINKANSEGLDFLEISGRYIEEYFIDAHGLNIMDADIHPRATETMDGIISLIKDLIDKGYAYSTDKGDVYFSTTKFDEYGKLSHQPLDDLLSGARIAVSDDKQEPMDFALWKSAKEGEPYWEAPWGKGRPGWHIECSAMVKKIFGDTVDIHGGGHDLIFPHHENEIAQSKCCNNAPLANYWMHNAFVNVDNKKMSKSLGNFFTTREVAKKYGYEPIRYFLLSSHYRSPINYSLDNIEQSFASLERLHNCIDNLNFLAEKSKSGEKDGEKELFESLLKHREHFINVMDDDLNTADAISCIFDLARDINTNINSSTNPSKELCNKAAGLFMELCDVLGILYEKKETDLDAEIDELIRKRTEARANKDWATADAIRDELAARNIVLEDTPNGVKWSRK